MSLQYCRNSIVYYTKFIYRTGKQVQSVYRIILHSNLLHVLIVIHKVDSSIICKEILIGWFYNNVALLTSITTLHSGFDQQ